MFFLFSAIHIINVTLHLILIQSKELGIFFTSPNSFIFNKVHKFCTSATK